jgi:hypothetical protein
MRELLRKDPVQDDTIDSKATRARIKSITSSAKKQHLEIASPRQENETQRQSPTLTSAFRTE